MDTTLELIDTDELDRLHAGIEEHLDIQESLADLSELATQYAGDNHPALERMYQIATSLAFAGTGVTAESLSISTESAGSTLKAAVATLVRMVRSAIQSVVAFFKRAWAVITTNTARLRFRSRRIRNRVTANRGRQVKRVDGKPLTLVLSQSQTYLRLDGKPITGARQISMTLDQMTTQLNAVLTVYVPGVKAVGQEMRSAYAGTKTPETILKELNAAAVKLPVVKLAGAISARSQVDSRWSLEREVLAGPAVLGDKALYCFHVPPTDMSNPTATARQLRSQVVTFAPTKNASAPTAAIELTTPSSDELLGILDRVDTLIGLIEDAYSPDVERALAECVRVVDKVAADAIRNDIPRTQYEILMRYNSTFARWATSPREAMVNHYVLVLGFLLTLCSRSIDNYR